MSHWLLDKLNETRQQALKQAGRAQILRELLNAPSEVDHELIRRTAEALEMVVLDLVLENISDNEEKQNELKSAAADAFRLLRSHNRLKRSMPECFCCVRAPSPCWATRVLTRQGG